MFTRFARRPQVLPIAGTAISLTAHAALLAVGVAADVSGTSHGLTGRGGRGAGTKGEGIHWVGVGAGSVDARARRDARPPVAYVIPGRGPLRIGVPASAGASGRGAGPEASPVMRPSPIDRVRRSLRQPGRLHLPLLPAIAEVDVAVLVPGVIAASIDAGRLSPHPEDFAPRVPTDGVAGVPAGVASLAVSALLRGRVDVLPIAVIGNPLPTYPDALARARIDGHVLVEFTIDSTGAVDVGSFRVLDATNALFVQAVRNVLRRLHFRPAQLGERSVGIRVRQPFVFTMRSGL